MPAGRAMMGGHEWDSAFPASDRDRRGSGWSVCGVRQRGCGPLERGRAPVRRRVRLRWVGVAPPNHGARHGARSRAQRCRARARRSPRSGAARVLAARHLERRGRPRRGPAASGRLHDREPGRGGGRHGASSGRGEGRSERHPPLADVREREAHLPRARLAPRGGRARAGHARAARHSGEGARAARYVREVQPPGRAARDGARRQQHRGARLHAADRGRRALRAPARARQPARAGSRRARLLRRGPRRPLRRARPPAGALARHGARRERQDDYALRRAPAHLSGPRAHDDARHARGSGLAYRWSPSPSPPASDRARATAT